MIREIIVLSICLFFTIANNLVAQDSLANYSLAELDTLYYNTQNIDKRLAYARAMLPKSVALYGQMDTSHAKTLIKLAITYRAAKDTERALSYLRQGIKILEERGAATATYGNSLNILGLLYYKQRKYSEVEAAWLESAAVHKAALGEKSPVYARNLNNLGKFYFNRGKYDQSEAFYLKALDVRKEALGDTHNDYIRTLHDLGNLYDEKDDFDNAKKFYDKALELREQTATKNNKYYASLISDLGLLYKKRGHYKKAEAFYLESLRLYEEITGVNSSRYTYVLNNLGTLYRNMGDYVKAEDYLTRMIEIQRELLGNKNIHYARSLFNLGNLYKDMGSYTNAASVFLESLRIREHKYGKEHPQYALALYELGGVYEAQGAYIKSEKYYKRALLIVKKTLGEEHSYYSTIISHIAGLYQLMGDTENALLYYQEAKSINQKIFGKEHPYYATTLNSLGIVYQAIKDYQSAESCYQEGLSIRATVFNKKHPSYIASLNHLGALCLEIDSLEEASRYIQLAIQSNTGTQFHLPIDSAGLVSLKEVNYISIPKMNKSLFLLFDYLDRVDNHSTDRLYFVADLALHLLTRGKNDLGDDKDKLRVLDECSEWVYRSIETLNLDKDIDRVFGLMEQNKSVLLLDESATKQVYLSGILPDSLVIKEKGLEKRYSAVQAALSKKYTEQELDSIRVLLNEVKLAKDKLAKNIQEEYPKYAALKFRNDGVRINELQAKLAEMGETAMLEYLIGDSVIYIIYVDAEVVRTHRVFVANEVLKNRIDILHNSLSNYEQLVRAERKSYQDYVTTAYWFYEQLIAVVLPENERIKNLVIVPDGALGYLPFETFLTKKANDQVVRYNDLSYLVQRYNISYNYSATTWNEVNLFRSNENNHQVLGLCANYAISLDSVKMGYRLSSENELRRALQPLPAARAEIEALRNQYKGTFIFDTLACEQVFKSEAANFGIIHLAMHGILNQQEPMLSSLAFTENGDSSENNLLHAYEISKMNLQADLVVLSACETAYGKFEQGNGIASLARSFAYAGVPAMVVSLWQVNDDATSLIMQKLYTNLADGLAKDAALRQAKLDYLEEVSGFGSHPAFWSPFIVMGNTSPVIIVKKGRLWFWGFVIIGVLVFGGVYNVWRKGRFRFIAT